MDRNTKLKWGIATVVVVLLGGYFGAVNFFASRELTRAQKWRAKMLAIKALADAQVPSLKVAELVPLRDACAGKLEPKGPKAIVSYMDPGDLPQGETSAGQVTGAIIKSDHYGYDFMEHAASEPEFEWLFREALDPGSWSKEEWHVDPSVASYAVITVPLQVEFPRLAEDDKSFSEGKAELRTRVFTWPEGKVLCEGVSEPTTPEKLELSGSGKTQEIAKARAALGAMDSLRAGFSTSILNTPLLEVCAAADPTYCEHIKSQLR